jgi:NADH:ubiquinone oxidoreductase subunit 6 (subunit J)
MEILIYVGAICVTIVFAVMLAEPDEAPSRETSRQTFLWGGAALLVSGAVFCGVSFLGVRHPWPPPLVRENIEKAAEETVRRIGISLLTQYSLAFELISLVLLVAILGALVIARYGRTKP